MEKPFFSIIIPTLNEGKFLPKLLHDLRQQKYRSFEVIVVDGNSEDQTVFVASSFLKQIRLSIAEVKKRHVSYQRNYGASLANGDFLVFLDADTRVNSTFLSKLHKEIERSKSVLFLPRYAPLDPFFQDKTVFTIFNLLIAVSQKTTKPFSLGACIIFEKNYFNHLGGFDDKLFISEDHDIVQRAKRAGVTTTILKSIPVKVSLRRFRREGRVEVLRKYFIATMHSLKTGGIAEEIFDYQMGGRVLPKNKTQKFDKEIYAYFKQLKKRLQEITTDQ